MHNYGMSRREALKLFGAAAALPRLQTPPSEVVQTPPSEVVQKPPSEVDESRPRRMQWWHAAKFGMFIHWGVYSVYGHHEWAMEEEGIPVAEYEQLAKQFMPKP